MGWQATLVSRLRRTMGCAVVLHTSVETMTALRSPETAVQVQLTAPETYKSALGPGKWLDALLQR